MVRVETLIHPVIELAKRAGEEILEIYQHSRQYTIKAKPDHSPVTQADLLADQVICQGLQALTPDIPIISEESEHAPFSERRHWEYCWSVDPIDGTLAFIQHSGEFTVNIALLYKHQSILGVIYVPVTGECYYAAEGLGAFKLEADQETKTIGVRTWPQHETILVASHGIKVERVQHLLEKLPNYQVMRRSSAWKFGLIAEGKADLYLRLGDTGEWDTAAGQCILTQAGGMIVNLSGQPLTYNTRASLLNPHFIALGDAAALMLKLKDELGKL